jgi:hypothetical protein
MEKQIKKLKMSTSLNKLYLELDILDDDTTHHRFKSKFQNSFNDTKSSTDAK